MVIWCPSRTFVLGQSGQSVISFIDLETIPPFLVQMPVVHEPSIKFFQFRAHLPANLGPALGFHPLLLGIFTMSRASRCKPHRTILCLGPCVYVCHRAGSNVRCACTPASGRACLCVSWPRTVGPANRRQSAMGCPFQGCCLSC